MNAKPPRESDPKPAGNKSRTGLWVALGLLGALVLIGATWVVAMQFQSPAQREAAAEPPAAQPVTVEVVRGDLVEQTTMMATASQSSQQSVELPLDGDVTVVTGGGIAVGGTLASGGVISWVNDHPLFALAAPFPFFRDFGEGDSGQDVREFQQALANLGYDLTPDGEFGAATADCVKDLFKQVGAVAPAREVEPEPTSSSASGSTTDGTSQTSTSTAKPVKQIVVRRADFVVLPTLPAQVVSVPAVGAVLTSESKLVLSDGQVSLTSVVPGPIASRLGSSPGGSAALGDQDIPVKVASVVADTSEGGEGQSKVTFTPIEGAFPTEWSGHDDILVSLDFSDPLKDVLVIPQRAVATNGSGGGNVLVQQADGSFTQVPVQVLGCVSGMCALDEDGDVAEGSRLRVDQ